MASRGGSGSGSGSGGGSDVVLHLYDLSMGMARSLSAAIVGTQIDLIPHTGIVVYGNEYFYGGGIQVRHSLAML